MTYQDQTIELLHGSGDPTHSIIWLHGLGASANDFPPVVPELGLSAANNIRFIFPQAPHRAITINGGMSMPGWYDIKGMNLSDKEDAEGMAESQGTLEAFIDAEIARGIPSENIVIAGFSQGGAVAYHTGVRSKKTLAGILALSTYLPFAENVETEQSGVNKNTPIFVNHGTYDPVVPIQLGKMSSDKLSSLGYAIEWKEYPMQHQVMLEQIKDIGRWIQQTLSK